MQAIPPWLWTAGGWALLALSGWLFASPWWRKHPGRWCHRCGYDMAGIPSLTCPECGRTAKTERHLTRKPSRRLRRVTAIILALTAWVLAHLPRTIERGPVALIPGWTLSLIAPINADDGDVAELAAGASQRSRSFVSYPFTSTSVIPAPTPPATRPIIERVQVAIFKETWLRLYDDEMGGWAAAHYLRRLFADQTPLRLSNGELPDRWPQDWELHLSGSVRAPGRLWELVQLQWRATYERDAVPHPLLSADAVVGGHSYVLEKRFLPIDVSKASAVFFKPVSEPIVDKYVGDMLSSRVIVKGESVTLRIDPPGALTLAPEYGALAVRVLLDGDHLAAGNADWCYGRVTQPALTWAPDGERRAREHAENLTVEFTGDPVKAAGLYTRDWRGDLNAWSGTITVHPIVGQVRDQRSDR